MAQKVSIDEIQKQCADLPQDQRVRLSVSSFKVSAPAAKGKFGQELADQLSNALQNVDCFNVLLDKSSIEDIEWEKDRGKTGRTDAAETSNEGREKTAQVVVIGRVTDYYSPGGYGTTEMVGKAKLGFTIQLVNVETREVIESKAINVQGKTFLGVGPNKSLADAMEKGINEAVVFIAANKDKLPLPVAAGKTKPGSPTRSAVTTTEITVTNADYAKVKTLADMVATKGKVLEKSAAGGKGFIRVEHDPSVDLAELIDAKLSAKYTIKEFTQGKLTVAAK